MPNNITVTPATPVVHKGADISKHNGNINWKAVDKNEIDFVIIRAGFGFSTVDPKFKENIEGAIQAGLDVGIYWFSYAHNANDAELEAKFCIRTIEPYREKINYPVFFDWEYDSDNYVRKKYSQVLGMQDVSNIAKAFMETIKANGYRAGNYSNIDYLNRYFNAEIKNNYDLWLAHVKNSMGDALERSSYNGKYTMHQYCWNGKPKGFVNKTDMNYAYYDYVPKPTVAPDTEQEKEKSKAKPEKMYQIPTNIDFYTDIKKNVITSFPYLSRRELRVSTHFQVKEFVSKKPDGSLYDRYVKIHNKLLHILEALFKELNCSIIIVNSGYRTPEHDKAVGGSGKGFHTTGRAADITCYDKSGKKIPAQTVCITLERMGGIYGIGYISPTSVHVDTRLKSEKWYGDETIKGAPSIQSMGYDTFYDYFTKRK